MITILGDFCQFLANKLAFSKKQCYAPIFAEISSLV
jgi:hypothetical protein